MKGWYDCYCYILNNINFILSGEDSGREILGSAEEVTLSGKRTAIGRNSGEPQRSTEGAIDSSESTKLSGKRTEQNS